MAMTTITPVPLFRPIFYGAGSAATTALNTTDDWVAFVFYWPGGDLTKAAIVCSAVSGSPVCTVQLFNTDATGGDPVNTGSAVGSAVDTATLVAGVPQTISGIGQAGLSAGIYALRVIFKSGTSATLLRGYNVGSTNQFPFDVTVNNGGAQTKGNGGVTYAFGVGGSSWLTTIWGAIPPALLTSTGAYNSGSNPDEYGLWATNPIPADVRVCGAFAYNGVTSRSDLRLAHYSGTLASPTQDLAVTFDHDLALTAVAGFNFLPYSTKQTVANGANFGIGIRAASADNLSQFFFDFTTGQQTFMDLWWGQNATLFTRENDTGALTQTTYRTPLIIPVIDGIDVSGGAGLLSSKPMAGNFQG